MLSQMRTIRISQIKIAKDSNYAHVFIVLINQQVDKKVMSLSKSRMKCF